MNNMPQFLLCENPTADDNQLYILHTREPYILARVEHYEDLSDERRMEIERTITIGSRLDYPPETIFFHALWVVEGDELKKITPQEQANTLAGIMRRMADWYEDYLEWEDAQ